MEDLEEELERSSEVLKNFLLTFYRPAKEGEDTDELLSTHEFFNQVSEMITCKREELVVLLLELDYKAIRVEGIWYWRVNVVD